MTIRRDCSALVAALLLHATTAAAREGRGTIEVRGERTAVDAARLDELVALELGSRVDPFDVLVEVDRGRAEIELRSNGKSRRGSVDLEGAGDVERTLALFIGELARTPEPPVPEASTNEAPRPIEAKAPAPSPLSPYVLVGAGVRWLAASPVLAVTPHLEGGLRVGPSLRLGATARYVYASADDTLGSVSAHAVTGGAAATYTFFAKPAVALATGPRGELGVVFGSGSGANSASTSAFVAGAAWVVELQLPLTERLRLLLSAEAGVLFRGLDLRADERTVLDFTGGFGGASAGLAL